MPKNGLKSYNSMKVVCQKLLSCQCFVFDNFRNINDRAPNHIVRGEVGYFFISKALNFHCIDTLFEMETYLDLIAQSIF